MSRWQWVLHRDHWIELDLGGAGLTYKGFDYSVPAGGGYMAGFQSVDQFLEDGPLNDMPEAIAAEVREAIAGRGGHRVTIRLSGPTPDQIHGRIDDQPFMLGATDVVFDGRLAAGEHTVAGVVIYPGTDDAGRRRMCQFEQSFTVSEDAEIAIDELAPRFAE